MAAETVRAREVCVVAGVGPGIGLAVARRFAREGFAVALMARRPDALAEHAAEIEADGGTARPYPVDLTDTDEIASAIARIEAEMGPASCLAYNAATWREAEPMALDPRLFAQDLALCVTGALACAQAAYPSMKKTGRGSMLFTGGGLALRPEYGSGVISLTAGKSALRGLVLALAPALAPDGIHVATVTVAGTVARETAFDPGLIADRFWALHAEDAGGWTTESVFDGSG